MSLDNKFVKLFHQQTKTNFAVGLISDELCCNLMPSCLTVKYPRIKEVIKSVVKIDEYVIRYQRNFCKVSYKKWYYLRQVEKFKNYF